MLNSNAKWQVLSDRFLVSLGPIRTAAIRQPFIHLDSSGVFDIVVIKIVDDIIATGNNEALRSFAPRFGNRHTLEKITNSCGWLNLFGSNIVQHKAFSCTVDGDKKPFSIEPYYCL